MDTLVWTRAGRSGQDLNTYWLAAGETGYQVKGEASGLFLAVGSHVWRWVVQEHHHKVICDEESVSQWGAETTSLALVLEQVDATGKQQVIRGDTKPLKCEWINDPFIRPVASVGAYLFVDAYYSSFGGGAHGINMTSFVVREVATGKDWEGWPREVSIPPDELERIQTSLGQEPGPRAPGSNARYVDLWPSSLRPSYAPGGSLSFNVCFSIKKTNIPELATYESRGAIEIDDCASVPSPSRFRTPLGVPASVSRFTTRMKVPIGGWSRLADGQPLAPAVQALFSRPK